MTTTRRAHGPTVRAIREALGLRSDTVATAAGLSKGYYSNLERGRRSPTVVPTAAIADALGVPVEIVTGQMPAIAVIRNALNLDATQVADDLGISPRQLDRIERGTETPDAELLARVATRLGVDVDALRRADTAATARPA